MQAKRKAYMVCLTILIFFVIFTFSINTFADLKSENTCEIVVKIERKESASAVEGAKLNITSNNNCGTPNPISIDEKNVIVLPPLRIGCKYTFEFSPSENFIPSNQSIDLTEGCSTDTVNVTLK